MTEFKNVSFSYGEKAVFKDFSLSIKNGVTVIEGPSGSGKTTLLKLLAGLLTPDSGTITGVPERPAFMFQENRLLPWLTAEENVAAVMPKDKRKSTGDFLEFSEIPELSKTLPGNISGGQQRRVSLARAIACGGDMLILDEPMKGLDEALITRLIPGIKELGVPIVVTSHSEFETKLWDGEIIRIENIS